MDIMGNFRISAGDDARKIAKALLDIHLFTAVDGGTVKVFPSICYPFTGEMAKQLGIPAERYGGMSGIKKMIANVVDKPSAPKQAVSMSQYPTSNHSKRRGVPYHREFKF